MNSDINPSIHNILKVLLICIGCYFFYSLIDGSEFINRHFLDPSREPSRIRFAGLLVTSILKYVFLWSSIVTSVFVLYMLFMRRRKFRKKHIIPSAIIIVLTMVIASGTYSDISVDDLAKEYVNDQSMFVDIDGMQVHYRDEGQGMPVVLIHGTAASLHTWDDWTSELIKTHRVIRMDLPAFGLTGPNKTRDYSIKSYKKFMDDFITQMEIDSFHLAGNSLGGNIAWNYALEHPEKVQKLILVDASGLPTGKPKPWIFKMANIPVLNTGFLYYTPKFLIEKNIKEVYADDSKITDQLLTRYHKMALREGNRQAFVDRAKLDFKQDSLTTIDRLKSIQNPTLLIWGEQDDWIPLVCGKAMNENIPNSTLEVLKNSGHVPMEENPEESVEMLKRFLEEN